MHIPSASSILLGCLAFAPLAALASERPNILLIVSEDNGQHLGCYGNPYVVTPHLDSLATDGVRFNRAYVTQAGCSPSRASIYTGLYPHQNGQLGLATWGFELYRGDMPNMVTSLNAAGYRTGIIGKLHINPEEAFPFDYSSIPGGNFQRKDLGDYALRAREFLASTDKPFFLAVNYPEAHQPFIAQAGGLPEKPLTGADVGSLPYFGVDAPDIRQIVADYYNCMSRLDVLVGDLLKELDASGKADNTLVIYLGDHGADMLRGKRTVYEGGVLIPLLIRWPDGAAAGQVRSELITTADLMPTILDLAEAAPVPGLAGRSMAQLLKQQPVEWRGYLFTEYHTHAATDNFYPQRAVRSDRYKLIENLLPGEVNPGYEFTMHHTDADFAAAIAKAPEPVRAAYRRMQQPARWELYDLQADPYEFNDLSGDPAHQQVLKELQAALADWRARTADPLLDPANLARFKAEVYNLPSKAVVDAGGYWQYMHYFFGKEPPSRAAKPTTKEKKSGKKKKKDGE